MRYSHRFAITAVGCTLLFSGCNQASTPETFDILQAGQPVPLLTTQALSVQNRLELGLSTQSLNEMQVQTLQTNDLEGYPFVNVTFTAPVDMSDVWKLGSELTGEEWAEEVEGEDSPWTTTITGATTVRDVLVVGNVGLDLLRDMATTVTALGGADQLQEIVAIEPQYFVLRDVQGTLWNIDEVRPLTEEEVKQAEDIYADIYAGNNTPETAEAAQEIWDETLESGDISAQSLGYTLENFAKADGSLDLKHVQQFVEGDAGLATLNRNRDRRRCFWFFCTTTASGYIRASDQATQSGTVQEPKYYDRRNEKFRIPLCLGFGNIHSDAPLGCAPSAFAGILLEKYEDGSSFFGKSYNSGRGTPSLQIAKELTAPTGRNKIPLIVNYMGSCNLPGGTMTLAQGFAGGAKKFLRDQGSSLELKYNYSHYAGNVWSAPAKARILVQEIGRDNNPVVAEYFRGFSRGHFSPVTEYRITYGATTGVQVRTMDDKYKWHSLSGFWGTQRGVFYLE